MIAALPMYDLPWLGKETDAFWATMRDELRRQGVDAPEALTRGGALHAQWLDPTLLFGQTCGYPYWKGLRNTVEILATPVYAFEGCDGPNHCSFLVARDDDLRTTLAEFKGARAALNGWDSNSGMNLFRAAVAPVADGRPFFTETIVTGAHAASLAAVREGRADLAAVDCVTFGLLAPEGLKIVARTPSSPALPFIASRALPEATRGLLREALATLPAQSALGLKGVAFLPESAYARVERLEAEAAAQGYPRLA